MTRKFAYHSRQIFKTHTPKIRRRNEHRHKAKERGQPPLSVSDIFEFFGQNADDLGKSLNLLS